MENILHDFNEKVISLMTEFLKNSIMEGGLSNFTEELNDKLMKLGYDLTKFSLEYAEDIIFKLKERKSQFESLEKDNRKIVTIFGEIDFKRRYYIDKLTNERVYLLDEYFKIAPKERLLENVETRLIEEAIETNYEKAGKVAAYKTEISKQTIMNKISELKINIEEDKIKTKKVVDNIYCIADEDHVHLQKGGIEEPRLIVVYDSVIKNGRRIKLCNKKHFGGVYTGRIDDLWEEVLTYIDNTYEIDKIKNIYILGDGASWIKTGLEWLPKSINVLDKFHLMKAVNGIVGKENKENKAEKAEYKKRIYRSFYALNFEETKEIAYEILAEEMEETVRNRKVKLLNYILNNKQGITNLYKHQKELHGCSAEGHISHLYSARLSSRPLGWKIINVNNVSKLRLIKADNKEIKEIVHNKRKVIEFKEIEKIRHDAREKIKSSINFKVGKIPAMEFGTTEQRKFFKQLLEYKEVC
jgi:hypothetical protein